MKVSGSSLKALLITESAPVGEIKLGGLRRCHKKNEVVSTLYTCTATCDVCSLSASSCKSDAEDERLAGIINFFRCVYCLCMQK